MTDIDILKWIKENLGTYIQKGLLARPGTIYSEDWIAGMISREVGNLIGEYAYGSNGKSIDVLVVCSLMRGDFTQRPGETYKSFHGYGILQADIKSFPEFIKSGDWKDPFKCVIKAIDILEAKRKYILGHNSAIAGASLIHYVTAAYNSGEGRELQVIQAHLDPDAYTTGHNYSSDVARLAEEYQNLN